MNLTPNYYAKITTWQGDTLYFAFAPKILHLALFFCTTLCTAFLATGCNSVFYYPDNVKYGDPAQLGYTTDEKMIESAPGTRIKMIRFHAVGKRKGTVVHFHGNAQNMTAHLAFTYWIPEQGYDLYIFDYQGYGASEGSPSRQATVVDGKAVIAEALRTAQGLPVFVLGQSLGAAVAFTAAAQLSVQKQPSKICALVLESGFASYRMIAREKLAQHWLTWPLQWPLSFLVSDELSPLLYVSQIQIPILFLHGRNDNVVPYSTGLPLYEAYRGSDKTWIEIPNAGHTPSFLKHESPYRIQTVAFFDSRAVRCKE